MKLTISQAHINIVQCDQIGLNWISSTHVEPHCNCACSQDGDNKISLTEYIGDMYHQDEATGDLEPEWVTAEKEQFSKYRDADNDGYMDLDEVRWFSL